MDPKRVEELLDLSNPDDLLEKGPILQEDLFSWMIEICRPRSTWAQSVFVHCVLGAVGETLVELCACFEREAARGFIKDQILGFEQFCNELLDMELDIEEKLEEDDESQRDD